MVVPNIWGVDVEVSGLVVDEVEDERVAEVDERVDELEEKVDEVEEKVEEGWSVVREVVVVVAAVWVVGCERVEVEAEKLRTVSAIAFPLKL
jgi:hypothetical protein